MENGGFLFDARIVVLGEDDARVAAVVLEAWCDLISTDPARAAELAADLVEPAVIRTIAAGIYRQLGEPSA